MGLIDITSKRSFKDVSTVALAEVHHWQLLCDLSNNDYDICYFGGKVTVADNFVSFLRSVEDEFYLQEAAEYLYKDFKNISNDVVKYPNNVNYKGALEEVKFLLRYCYKEYIKNIMTL